MKATLLPAPTRVDPGLLEGTGAGWASDLIAELLVEEEALHGGGGEYGLELGRVAGLGALPDPIRLLDPYVVGEAAVGEEDGDLLPVALPLHHRDAVDDDRALPKLLLLCGLVGGGEGRA